jgi:hypothetical protein
LTTQFKILFDETSKPLGIVTIKKKLSHFSKSYDKVVKIVIEKSEKLSRDTFNFNIATLMPPFKMTRNKYSVFYGMKIEEGILKDSDYNVLDSCWKKFGTEFKEVKEHISENVSHRNRALLELPEDKKNIAVEKVSKLFDELEWTTINDHHDIKRVGASKILFALFPEFALPVDNDEWDILFRTHDYGKILSTMINEIKEWEKKLRVNLETLNTSYKTTLPSVYNVLAMEKKETIKN